MSRGNHFIKEVLKYLNFSKDQTDYTQSQHQIHSQEERRSICNEKSEEQRNTIQLKKRSKNPFIRLTTVFPNIPMNHIYKLFGFLGINQRALEDPDYDESYFKTHFHDRTVEKVQLYDNAVVIHLTEPEPQNNPFSLAQIIENYRRKGNVKFMDLSTRMLQVCELFGQLGKGETPSEKLESFKKSLDSLGNTMFVCTSGLRKVAVSKSLLEYLQYDIDEFSIEAVKFKGIYTELFSANSYFLGLMHMLNMLKYTIQLNKNQITLSEFRELSNFHFTDFAYSKNYVKSFCDMNIELLSPSVLCHRINFVYYKSDELGWKQNGCKLRVKAIESQKERVRQGEYKVIKRVKNIPDSLLSENRRLIAEYKDIQVKQAEKMEES